MSIFGSETKLALNSKKKSGGLIGFSSPGTPKARNLTPKPQQKSMHVEINTTPQLRNQSMRQENTPKQSRPENKAPVVDTSSDGSDESDDDSEEEIQHAVVKQNITVQEGSEDEEEESEEESAEEPEEESNQPNVTVGVKSNASVSNGLCPPGYNVLNPSGMISAELLEDPDNEIFFVKMPSSVNPKSLLNKPLPLTKGKRVAVGDQELETVTYPSNKDGTLILAETRHGGFKAVPLAGKVFFQISLDVPSLPDVTECPRPEPPLRELPSGLKIRHPLLGSDYQAMLDDKVTKEKQSRNKRALIVESEEGLAQEPSKKKKRIKKEVS